MASDRAPVWREALVDAQLIPEVLKDELDLRRRSAIDDDADIDAVDAGAGSLHVNGRAQLHIDERLQRHAGISLGADDRVALERDVIADLGAHQEPVLAAHGPALPDRS